MIQSITASFATARRPLTCLMVALVAACAAGRCAAQQADRSVTLAWFPDFSLDGKWLVVPYGRWGQDDQGEVRVCSRIRPE